MATIIRMVMTTFAILQCQYTIREYVSIPWEMVCNLQQVVKFLHWMCMDHCKKRRQSMWYTLHMQLGTGCPILLISHTFSALTKSPSWALNATYMSLHGNVSPMYVRHDRLGNKWGCRLRTLAPSTHISVMQIVQRQSPSTQNLATCKIQCDFSNFTCNMLTEATNFENACTATDLLQDPLVPICCTNHFQHKTSVHEQVSSCQLKDIAV